MKFGILLDSGRVWPIKAMSQDAARSYYRWFKQERREQIRRKELVTFRQALGFIKFTLPHFSGRPPGSEAAKRLGSRGGTARAAKLSAERRAEIAKIAAKARWESKSKGNEHGK